MIIQSNFALKYKLTKEIYKIYEIVYDVRTYSKKVFFAISDDVIRFFKNINNKVNIYIPIGNRNQMIKFENVQYRG